ncbi:phospholipase C, phosphocholine-specific [uncultured Imperialibacter sp.]|uniref:phosphocholine-specific phospholipase C n=1 Tax=uncultured Imperialibacter sp. TaxID=1672639 RepID=UPI0030D776AC|tara:strand:- start:13191 stop:15692 length:2502 start_codon:yes stop_codon:yes gene_type:complete
MSDSRREFLKKAALLAGGTSVWSTLPISIEKALAISPDPGTTFYDAEHVVVLMQENRSFDHCFGMLKGVRGFNDPLAISLPDKNPVWFQPDSAGNRFAPFRLDMKDTKATWMGGVPHSWEDQVDARNNGKYDGWIEAKRPGNKDYKHIPLTMGYYTREDIPFYYSLADAFTVCDQHFCAALTGTTTNRSYHWTGKTHGEPGDKAKVRNGEVTYGREASWATFPERLEDNGISWKVYQNEISLPTNVEDESLLANFTDNNLEWFTQYGVRYSKGFHEYLKTKEKELPSDLAALEKQLNAPGADKLKLQGQIDATKKGIDQVNDLLQQWTPEAFEKLSARAKNLHNKAFTTNIGDPDYHKVEDMTYSDNGTERTTKVPKGDILHQFRKDVKEGKLPTVSWLAAPQKFSDHPSAPWYGAWYVSEIMDILTENPEVWKKTIFILNYDENDGYFDHIPPFVAPNPADPNDGKISDGLKADGEYVTVDEEIKAGFDEKEARTSPVGLGYRVPLIVASPWSRGGWVNSEVCDITSTIMFMEKFLSKKTGKKIEEPNISSWRRAISGDLTSVFRPYNGEQVDMPAPLDRNRHIQEIYNASFKGLPNNFKPLKADTRMLTTQLPKQEPGTKPSNALGYELHVTGNLAHDSKHFRIRFKAGKGLFGENSLGAPFNVYAPGKYRNPTTSTFEPVKTWAFAVKAGDEIEYQWPLDNFEDGQYHLRVYGPNGFFREFVGNEGNGVDVTCIPEMTGGKVNGKLKVSIINRSKGALKLELKDDKYQHVEEELKLKADGLESVTLNTASSKGWYDFSVTSPNDPNLKVRFAGRLETGADSISDPYMGRG